MKNLGYGIGLRPAFMAEAMSGSARVDWYEALSENFLGFQEFREGPALDRLLKVREHYPVVLHGVSLGIGGADPLNREYLNKLKNLKEQVQAEWISDHLCWSSLGGHNLHDLLPLRYSRDVLDHVCARIEEAQDFLGQRLLFENVSSYISYRGDQMQEWEFIAEITRKTGCALLLDLNNIFVSSRNHGFDPNLYLDAIPLGAVQQVHLAGPLEKEGYFIDTHDSVVREEVWALYARFLSRFGKVSTMLEWDEKVPPLQVVEQEIGKAKKLAEYRLESRDGMARAAARI
jgi:uncharacterized protein (UPF0276 family)